MFGLLTILSILLIGLNAFGVIAIAWFWCFLPIGIDIVLTTVALYFFGAFFLNIFKTVFGMVKDFDKNG